ncbi:hypothetical protein AWB74_06873 [Caballeronia arvi]|uniref:Uncharacterized protein n=1 Tax=Caballeronia arvi TaxID=1777135 RepID=A0A158KTE7_9BURK|nr:hypothetical protein [Caballeronia arvi]SAL84245.1 hypothetical protein AWB74_06873 [Caballeronia arvi]
MTRSWKIPTVPELKAEEPPTIWVPVIALFIILAAGIIVTILTWKQGVSIISAEFFARALLIPVLIWGALCALYYHPFEDWSEKTTFWNWRCKGNYARWRYWTQWHVAIIDSAVVTPEVDLAERMLGLEGDPPNNTGKSVPLQPGLADNAERVLEKLIAPLAKHVKRIDGTERLRLILQARDDALIVPLMSAFTKLGFGKVSPSAISRIDPGKEASLVAEWLKPEEPYYGYGQRERAFDACLLVAAQFNQEGVEPDCTEAAVALFITSASVAAKYKFEPQAKLFRPAVAAPAKVSERLHAMQTAAPTPLEHFKHIWHSSLPKLARHNTVAAIEANEKKLIAHDLDQAIGKPGPASPWLLQALAARMVTFGQGPQLIAVPDEQGVMLNFVASNLSHVPDVPDNPPLAFGSFSLACLLACLGGLMMLLIASEKVGPVWFWTILGVTLMLIVVGVPAGSILKCRRVDDEFWSNARR